MENENEWRYQIGELMVRFAEIESYVAGCLISLPEKNLFEEHKDKSFKRKCGAAKIEIEKSEIRSKTKDKLVSSINDAIELAKTRNLVAHNPINLSLQSIFENKMRYEIVSYRNTDETISLENLKQVNIKVQACSTELGNALEDAEIEKDA